MLGAHLDEADIAVHLEVDPKTVRRWLEGRVPYTRHRWALAELLGLEETHLWPKLRTSPSRPDEILAIYPHRSTMPSDIWRNLFASAEHEISILDYGRQLLVEETSTLCILREKACAGIKVRIALAGISNSNTTEPRIYEPRDISAEESHNMLALRESLNDGSGVQIRFYRAVLYNSIYHIDEELMCVQHVYGNPDDLNPVLHLRSRQRDGLANIYVSSFEKIWNNSCLD